MVIPYLELYFTVCLYRFFFFHPRAMHVFELENLQVYNRYSVFLTKNLHSSLEIFLVFNTFTKQFLIFWKKALFERLFVKEKMLVICIFIFSLMLSSLQENLSLIVPINNWSLVDILILKECKTWC